MRQICVRLHRWAGLSLALFLILSGLTGSVIAFHHELDRRLNPEVLTVEPTAHRAPVASWIDSVQQAHPQGQVSFVVVPQAADEPAVLYLAPRMDPATGEPYELAIDQAFVHPSTAELLGSRDRDGFHLDRLHLIPFLYTLHYSLHLGQWGMWFFGAVGVVWFFDSFVGIYLAWPQRTWRAVKRALTVKWRSSTLRVNYDLHRAGGLWVWAILLVLAFSGVSMNLHEELFDPLVNAIAPMTPWAGDVVPEREDPTAPLQLSVADAISASETALVENGIEGTLGSVWLEPAKGLYHLGYHTPSDVMREHAGTWVSVSAADSSVLAVRPAGGHTVGDIIHDWQFPLHSGKAFGLAGRILICISGIVTAMLSATGIVIWWKKRRGRNYQRRLTPA